MQDHTLYYLPAHLGNILFVPEKNNLSFIETSALDSTNVEEAFKNILTGDVTEPGWGHGGPGCPRGAGMMGAPAIWVAYSSTWPLRLYFLNL